MVRGERVVGLLGVYGVACCYLLFRGDVRIGLDAAGAGFEVMVQVADRTENGQTKKRK